MQQTFVPLGLGKKLSFLPSDESLGYFQTILPRQQGIGPLNFRKDQKHSFFQLSAVSFPHEFQAES
jgi:hypothetical protein